MEEPLKVPRLTILFVDSDPNAPTRMQQIATTDFVVHCVASIQEAREHLLTSVPDLIITEVVVGKGNGLDFCRALRHDPTLRHIPIMILTSLSTLSDKVTGFEAGADDYVVKPFDAQHLQARIRLLLRIKRLERSLRSP